MPAVSFLKAPGYQDGHAGYSTPLDEQTFLVDTINRLEKSSDWASTAVVIAYDDSDGWYDHQMGPVVSKSADRRGYGPRLPLLVISPYARANFVDHTVTDQSSILRFIEDNWSTGRIGNGSFDALAGSLTGMFDFSTDPGQRNPALTLDPATGLVTH
jgi:phospholipase C